MQLDLTVYKKPRNGKLYMKNKCSPADAKYCYVFKIMFSAKLGGLCLGIFILSCFDQTGILELSCYI